MKETNRKHGCLYYVFVIILAIVVVFGGGIFISLFSGDSNPSPSSKPSSGGSTEKEDVLPTISKQVIYEDDTVIVRINGLEYQKYYGDYYYIVRATLKNKSEETIHYSSEVADVNGYSIDAFAYGDIYAGMTTDADLYLSKDLIELAGIKKIQTVKGEFVISEPEDYEEICVVPIDLKTSANGEYQETYGYEGGTTSVNNNDYNIVLLPLNKPTINKPLGVYIENKTDYTITVSYQNIALNNQMVAQLMSGFRVLPHSHAVRIMEVLYYGDEPNIKTVEDATVGFYIIPIIGGHINTGNAIEIPGATVKY